MSREVFLAFLDFNPSSGRSNAGGFLLSSQRKTKMVEKIGLGDLCSISRLLYERETCVVVILNILI